MASKMNNQVENGWNCKSIRNKTKHVVIREYWERQSGISINRRNISSKS